MQIFYTTHHPSIDLPDTEIYTDGSFFASLNKCGSAAVMLDGTVLLAKPPGALGIYKAKLVALYLASTHATPGSTIYTDSWSAYTVLRSKGIIVAEAGCVNAICRHITNKNLTIIPHQST